MQTKKGYRIQNFIYQTVRGKDKISEMKDKDTILKLDQSTPQTIINGSPIFNVGIQTPKLFPITNSTNAIQIMKADGTTNILTVDTTNSRIGIGTTTPLYLLDVKGSARINSDSTATFKVNSNGEVGAARSFIQLTRGLSPTENGWDLSSNISQANDEFTIRSIVNSVASTPLTILKTGNVGIGTTTPSQKLDIRRTYNGAVSYNLYLANEGTGNGTGLGIEMAAMNSTPTLRDQALISSAWIDNTAGSEDSYLAFSTRLAGSIGEKLRIDNLGNVGIGTTAPYSLLDVGGSSQVNASIIPVVSMTANNNSIRVLQLQNKSSDVSAEMRFITVADDGTYLAFAQPSSGNTGTFFGSTKSTGSFIFNTANNGIARDLYLGTIDNKNFYIGTNNTVKVTVLNTGNVGIGITNPAYPLQLYNATKSYFAIYTAESKNTAFSFQQGSGNGTTGNNSFFMGIDGNASDVNFGYGGGTNDVLISTYYGSAFRNLLRFPIGTQNAIFYGNVGIGTTSPTAKLSVAEKGAINEIGGHMIKLTNKTGSNSVKGTVVYASTGTDNAFNINPIDGDMPIGVVYTDGIADGAECWVVVAGIAEVLLVDTVATTRSYVAYSSNTTAGRIDTASTIPAATTHFREIGHTLESKTGGTNVLVKCVLHFN